MQQHHLVALLAPLLLIAPAVAAPPTPRADTDDLTREWAEFRRAQIASVAYNLQFTLREDADTFRGAAELDVALNHTDAPLSIDLHAEKIHSVTINGTPVDRLVKRTGSFDIPAASLSADPMTIAIDYTGRYAKSRDGLVRYIDSLDDREYLHSNLEPYAAHHVFPCFNQPDIKARHTLTVTAPAAWELIGNMPPASESTSGANKTVTFETTPLLSTYLFFLGAGDYRVWRDQHDGLPLALYARASLADPFDPERLFAETKAGLDYFNAYYETPYPFAKYDHVFAPGLGPGAMENPGAVTMNESMIFRGQPTAENYRRRNNILLHEMAHMWFGNLVTMAWWNDLWLNESFATFSAFQAQEAIGEYTNVWDRFVDLKGWAYNQDQLSTTHPVEVDVSTAQEAIANFDGITYAKGASALKQLWFTTGPEAYRRGVATYFRQYAWKNATRAQFMETVAGETGMALDTWTERWLRTEGLSRMAVDLDCADGTISGLAIRQEPVNAPARSPHRTRISLLAFNDLGRLVPYATLPVSYDGARTAIDGFDGQPCPDFVHPNHGDMDYGLFFLDDRSFKTVQKHLHALEDPFTRRMVWDSLYRMVRHRELRASVLMDMLLDQIPRETDTGMLAYLLSYRPTREVLGEYLAPEAAGEYAPRLADLLWNGYENAAPGTDTRLHWLDAFIGAAGRREDGERLRELLDIGPAGGSLDQPRRWRIIQKLAAMGDPEAESRIAAELEQDPTDRGKRYAFSSRGALPTLRAKRSHWKRLTDPGLAHTLSRAGARTFYNSDHPNLVEAFVDDWFDYVTSRDWEAESHRISVWFGPMVPPVYTREFLARSEAALAAATLPARARRAWQESNDTLERILAIRAYDAGGESPAP